MAKINRYDGNVKAFGEDSTGLERTVFGEETQANDLDSNLNLNFLRGWGIVGANENPTKQDFNAAFYTVSQLIAYLHQMGVPEWNAAQEFYAGAVVTTEDGIYRLKSGGDGSVDPDTDGGTNWEVPGTGEFVGLTDNQTVAGVKTFSSSPIVPTPTTDTQSANKSYVDDAVAEVKTPGMVAWLAVATAPAGWLACNGAAISRSTYSNLFAVIGATFGSGDGSTTFNIPDLRGEFIRGWDDGREVDKGRAFGSLQSDTFRTHRHSYDVADISEGDAGSPSQNVGSDGVANYDRTLISGAAGDTETRPRNIALLACIRY